MGTIAAIGLRTFWEPQTVLVTGAGPIGLLAALIGEQKGWDSTYSTGGPPARSQIWSSSWARPTTGAIANIGLQPHIVVECTGVAALIQQAMQAISPGGIICLTGVGSPNAVRTGSAAALATEVVLKNIAAFGSVNANRRHYYRAAKVLAAADRSWLEQLVTRRVTPGQAQQALEREPDDIKVVMEFAQA